MLQLGNKHLCFHLKTEKWHLSGKSYYPASEPIPQNAAAGKNILFPVKLLDVHEDASITGRTVLFVPLRLKCQIPARLEA